MTEAEVAKLTDEEVVKMAGTMGPVIIGEALFNRAQAVKKINPDGKFGPAILGSNPAAAPVAPAPVAAPVVDSDSGDDQRDGPDDGDDDEPLPSVSNLKEYIATLSAEEVEALMFRDPRKTAAPIYEARIDELTAPYVAPPEGGG